MKSALADSIEIPNSTTNLDARIKEELDLENSTSLMAFDLESSSRSITSKPTEEELHRKEIAWTVKNDPANEFVGTDVATTQEKRAPQNDVRPSPSLLKFL